MCFSASASFGAGLVLTVAGVITIRQAKTTTLAFAAIPFIFAVQQITEGFSWLGLSGSGHEMWKLIPAYVFLFFSHVVWPIWMPFSIMIIEKNLLRKKIITILFAAGCLLAAYHFYYIIAFGAQGEIVSCHINYNTYFPKRFDAAASLLYGLVTVIPFFVSEIKKMWLFGLALIVSYFVSKIFYEEYLVSVFCFFAAILSLIIFVILNRLNSEAFSVKQP